MIQEIMAPNGDIAELAPAEQLICRRAQRRSLQNFTLRLVAARACSPRTARSATGAGFSLAALAAIAAANGFR